VLLRGGYSQTVEDPGNQGGKAMKRRMYVPLVIALLVLLGCSNARDKALKEYNKGVEYEAKGMTDLAEQHYKFALDIDPSSADAEAALGTLYLAAGYYDDARDRLLRAFQLYNEAWERGDVVTYLKGYTPEEAIARVINNIGVIDLRRAVLDEAKFGEVDLEQIQLAMMSFEKALEFDPESVQAKDNIKRIREYYKIGD